VNGYRSTWVYREIASHARVAGEGFSTLSCEPQEAVAEFRRILQKEKASGMTFREALDEFIGEHPELLLRLTH
jgi:hypothetical protein